MKEKLLPSLFDTLLLVAAINFVYLFGFWHFESKPIHTNFLSTFGFVLCYASLAFEVSFFVFVKDKFSKKSWFKIATSFVILVLYFIFDDIFSNFTENINYLAIIVSSTLFCILGVIVVSLMLGAFASIIVLAFLTAKEIYDRKDDTSAAALWIYFSLLGFSTIIYSFTQSSILLAIGFGFTKVILVWYAFMAKTHEGEVIDSLKDTAFTLHHTLITLNTLVFFLMLMDSDEPLTWATLYFCLPLGMGIFFLSQRVFYYGSRLFPYLKRFILMK
ncbi:hypothetical protein EGI22_16100 [Lacihabitans sp. LS3-19]|uniref:hypothetical protein n=1 Tax=Lacihabitans sp. LS3-19 TaxID=2487335 RepID=UPI0020CCC776|nr:hypothetical protein [Lacihabitans sp. LS3-19]MCP9769426.1 hypothetical protein [Lacihabitans sp. LS3-19]